MQTGHRPETGVIVAMYRNMVQSDRGIDRSANPGPEEHGCFCRWLALSVSEVGRSAATAPRHRDQAMARWPGKETAQGMRGYLAIRARQAHGTPPKLRCSSRGGRPTKARSQRKPVAHFSPS